MCFLFQSLLFFSEMADFDFFQLQISTIILVACFYYYLNCVLLLRLQHLFCLKLHKHIKNSKIQV